jgi:hypothetical protein
MLRTKVSRIACSALFVAGGLVGVGSSLITGATSAGALTTCNPAPLMCLTPSAAIVNHQMIMVVVQTGVPHETIAVTECNVGVAGGDPNACDSNPADLGKPGGPMLATTGGKGTARLSYKVKVSSTKPVGDGNCLPGGDSSGVPCFLIAADISTQQPVANPAPFTTQ